MGTIYFIREEDGPIKIGYTGNNIKSRLSQLQTSNAKQLLVLTTVKGDMKDEKMLHARFSPYHITGEWFKPSKELLDYIYPLSSKIQELIKVEFPIDLRAKLIEIEKEYIKTALKKTKGNVTRAAKLLDISYDNLHYRLKANRLRMRD